MMIHEYADIASGLHEANESLADEVFVSSDHLASAAQKETQNPEAKVDSAIQQYLAAALHKIQKQIKNMGSLIAIGEVISILELSMLSLPCMQQHDAAVQGLQPEHLCQRDIFVWLPAYLPGAPVSFTCTCGKNLSKNGRYLFCFFQNAG